ncbi:hypothetical protein ANN_01045 [Periplaneta americana]|uniref:Uncharacterized protein n=1 Tax=Periplaneta americana TaxID=6978 RepID=A0ABQ8TUW1_PERAM|nr:hypothetical protein ANN_01045 [Periplaneta americana]
MAGLYEGGNVPPGSLKAIISARMLIVTPHSSQQQHHHQCQWTWLPYSYVKHLEVFSENEANSSRLMFNSCAINLAVNGLSVRTTLRILAMLSSVRAVVGSPPWFSSPMLLLPSETFYAIEKFILDAVEAVSSRSRIGRPGFKFRGRPIYVRFFWCFPTRIDERRIGIYFPSIPNILSVVYKCVRLSLVCGSCVELIPPSGKFLHCPYLVRDPNIIPPLRAVTQKGD